jgi:hypothetical protein
MTAANKQRNSTELQITISISKDKTCSISSDLKKKSVQKIQTPNWKLRMGLQKTATLLSGKKRRKAGFADGRLVVPAGSIFVYLSHHLSDAITDI